jgi:hypothetical protein
MSRIRNRIYKFRIRIRIHINFRIRNSALYWKVIELACITVIRSRKTLQRPCLFCLELVSVRCCESLLKINNFVAEIVKVGIKTVRTVLLKCEVVVLKSIEGGKNIPEFFFIPGQLPKVLSKKKPVSINSTGL